MARQYKRDARGRFASGGSSGRRAGGTLAARASLRRSRQKLAAKDPADASLKGTLSGRAQRAAVTRANKRLQQASRASRVTIAGARGGTLRRPAGYKPPGGRAAASAPANSIRPTGGSIRNKGAKNKVVPYKPTSLRGQAKQLQRRTKTLRGRIDRDVKKATDVLRSLKSKTRDIKPKLDLYMRRIERENARSITNRGKKGVDGVIARADLDTMGSGPGRKAITRRMNRALGAASRGSKPAQRAVRVYLDQLAGMGPGKPSRGRNNLRPGPRNTKGAPKRKRKGRGKG